MTPSAAIAALRSALNEHGLHDWNAELSTAKTQLGVCSHRSKTIKLSTPFVQLIDDDEVMDTILHEIAHALVGPKHGHDWVWKAKCREIGAKPERCADASVPTPPRRYLAVCDGCGKQLWKRHILLPVHFRWKTRCCHVTVTWHDTQASQPAPPRPTPRPQPLYQTLDLDYSSMTPGQKAAYTKRMRASAS